MKYGIAALVSLAALAGGLYWYSNKAESAGEETVSDNVIDPSGGAESESEI